MTAELYGVAFVRGMIFGLAVLIASYSAVRGYWWILAGTGIVMYLYVRACLKDLERLE